MSLAGDLARRANELNVSAQLSDDIQTLNRIMANAEARKVLQDATRSLDVRLIQVLEILSKQEAQFDFPTAAQPVGRMGIYSFQDGLARIRSKLFGSPEAPFSECPEAFQWLSAHATVLPITKASLFENDRRLLRAYVSRQPETRKLNRFLREKDLEVTSLRPRALVFYRDWSKPPLFYCLPEPDSVLVDLHDFVNAVERDSGWPQPYIIAKTLCSESHRRPRWEVVRRAGGQETLTESARIKTWRYLARKPSQHEGWTIEIYSPDIRRDELREAYYLINSDRPPRRELLDEDDEILWEEILNVGTPPPKHSHGTGEYWDDIAHRCKKKGTKFETADATQRRYKRLLEKIDQRDFTKTDVQVGSYLFRSIQTLEERSARDEE